MKCECGGDIIPMITPNLTHYGKEICNSCNKWYRWISDPEKEKIGKNQTLIIHHKIPLIEGGEDILDNLLMLCTSCHRLVHWMRLYQGEHFK